MYPIAPSDIIQTTHLYEILLEVVNPIMRRCEMPRQGKDWWKVMTGLEKMINAWADAYNIIQQMEGGLEVFHLH